MNVTVSEEAGKVGLTRCHAIPNVYEFTCSCIMVPTHILVYTGDQILLCSNTFDTCIGMLHHGSLQNKYLLLCDTFYSDLACKH